MVSGVQYGIVEGTVDRNLREDNNSKYSLFFFFLNTKPLVPKAFSCVNSVTLSKSHTVSGPWFPYL